MRSRKSGTYSFVYNMYNNGEIHGTVGEPVCCFSVNTGLVAAVIEKKVCEWISVGHDHNNDYYGEYNGIKLAFGRKTGFGQYGPDYFRRGARIFEITMDPYSIETYIREADGNIVRQEEGKKRALTMPA